jgi:hypothetical protein
MEQEVGNLVAGTRNKDPVRIPMVQAFGLGILRTPGLGRLAVGGEGWVLQGVALPCSLPLDLIDDLSLEESFQGKLVP